MNLVDAVRLQAGDRITDAGDVRETDKWSVRYSGTVIRVTDKGGILIEDDDDLHGVHWIGYSRVRGFIMGAGRPLRVNLGPVIAPARRRTNAGDLGVRHDPQTDWLWRRYVRDGITDLW